MPPVARSRSQNWMCRASPTSARRYAIERAPFPRTSSTNTLPGRPQFENPDLSELDLSKWDISGGRKFASMVRATGTLARYLLRQLPVSLPAVSEDALGPEPSEADVDDAKRCGYNRYGAPASRCASRLPFSDAPAVFNLTPDVLPQFKGVDADASANNELDTAKLPLRDRILLSSDAQIAGFDVSKETDFRDLVRMRPNPTAPPNP